MALPKFSFSGWTSQSLAPKVNPASVPGATGMASQAASAGGAGMGLATPGTLAGVNAKVTPTIRKAWAAAAGMAPGTSAAMLAPGAPAGTADTITGTPGQLVGTTNAANTNLPAWLQAEVDRINAQDALRKTLTGQVTGTAPPAFDPNIGVAAVTNARANYNAQINQMNEAARLQNLIQQRNQINQPAGAFGFNAPFQAVNLQNLDRQIDAYRNVNLPISAGGNFRPSGWASPSWAQPTWR